MSESSSSGVVVLHRSSEQTEISRIIMKGKCLQRRLKTLDTSTIPPYSKKPIPPTDTTEPLATIASAKKDSTETASTASLSLSESDTTHSTETVADTSVPPPTSPAVQHDTRIVNTTVWLPWLDLPTFSGNALEWQDGFEAAVHHNPAISELFKIVTPWINLTSSCWICFNK